MPITIHLNPTGTRRMELTDANLETLRRHNLCEGLRTSAGVVDETALEKLRRTLRSLIANGHEDTPALLDLCIDVIYHPDMKAYGLARLLDVCGQ